MGKYSVLINTVLFVVYHLWSSWMIVAGVIAFLPLFYWVYKKDSLKLSIIVHCLANFTDVVALVMLL
jgi:membrane protease YdiL (CAAX protease family)